MTEATALAATPHVQSWRRHGAALLLIILLILLQFRDQVAAAVSVWWIYETYSHCFLVLPISLWLIYERRQQVARLQPSVEPRALLALPVVLFAWWLGELATINEVRQLAVVALIQLAIVALFGVRVFKEIWFPVLYLVFLVPAGQYLVAPMQHFATVFVDICLNAFGIPHHTEGTLIELTNGQFEIAEACAGLRFLIATIALGVLFAYMMFRKWYKVVLFLLACVVVPLVGNGLRVVGIILLAHFTSNEYGVGADHLIYGWVFNVAILLVLFFLGSLFRDAAEERTIGDVDIKPVDSFPRLGAVVGTAAALILAGPALARWQAERPSVPNLAGLERPMQVPGWQSIAPFGIWHPNFPDADGRIFVVLAETTADRLRPPVEFYLAYYAHRGMAHALTAHNNHLWDVDAWTLISGNNVDAHLHGKTVRMQEWVLSSPAERRIIWATYWIDGEFTASPLAVKLLQIPAALRGHEGQAIVAVSTGVEVGDNESRARLARALEAMAELPARLGSVAADKPPGSAN